MPLPAFLPSRFPSPLRRPRQHSPRCPPRMASVPLQERVLRLERALAAAVLQERYTDAASLRDALIAARHADPLLYIRSQLDQAVQREDFSEAARLRDELAALTERFSRGGGRRIDRIIVLKGRGDPESALRVATVSREGDLQLGLVPDQHVKSKVPKVYLQPTWSPSGDFVAMTEISFDLDSARLSRGVAIANSSSRIVIMNAFDGTVVKSASLLKPPFFYFWSPDGRCVTLLSNDPTTSATTVALSVLPVVAPPGAGGLDLETVTGPLASGHPFLFDFCPRDSSRVVAHMGDKNSVAIVPVAKGQRAFQYLTKNAGTFGAPQWHPMVGRDGREVVLFVENKETVKADDEKLDSDTPVVHSIWVSSNGEGVAIFEGDADNMHHIGDYDEEVDNDDDDDEEDDAANQTNGEEFSIENLLSSGSMLLESVFRKGAESLGLTGGKEEKSGKDGKRPQSDGESTDNEGDGSIQERFKNLLSKKIVPEEIEATISLDGMHLPDPPVNKLIMCDVDNPEKRKEIHRSSGALAFKLSPDGEALATLVTNPITGQDELTVTMGNFAPDIVDPDYMAEKQPHSALALEREADVILSNPKTRVLAFFWSPDGKKLLFLTSLRESKVGAAQWATFHRQSNKVVRYEKFVISGIYMHCLNFFDQFGASMTPWSPDSDAFCYPGRPLSKAELEVDQYEPASSSPSISVVFMQKDGILEGKRFSARVQNVPVIRDENVVPEDPRTIMDNVEYACWSPC
eukprot:GFKZ01013088.1.p2 GENE.GFKZ01013088.1~~GFKZ01013088.1.p2  ORF type:complete len:745 (+),score=124.68 GFKZ01013088.1:306-2540(+)